MNRSEFVGKKFKSRRLPGYDYSQPGCYFVTMGVKDRLEIFGCVLDGSMILNNFGKIVETCWLDLPNHYPHCILDSFAVMPNHVHAIVRIVEPDVNPKHGLSEIIRAWKSFSSRRINEMLPFPKFVWQRSFRDSVIRDEAGLERVRAYIANNPAKWGIEKGEEDEFFD